MTAANHVRPYKPQNFLIRTLNSMNIQRRYPHTLLLILSALWLLFFLGLAPLAGQDAKTSTSKGSSSESASTMCPMMQEGGTCPMHSSKEGHGSSMHGSETHSAEMGKKKGHGGHMKGKGGHRELMANIHGLIDAHASIEREVENIEGGVVTITRATDPELVETLQTHVAQMYALIESGGSIRHWDPLFVEIFEHAEQIVMETELLEDGIRVTETSEDPYVAKLIQAHARKVNEFVERGMEAMHEPTPVPER